MSFCKLLSNQCYVYYDTIKPCCWYKGKGLSIFDAEEIQNHTERLANITDWIPECNYCHTLENSGVESPRLFWDKHPLFQNLDNNNDVVKIDLQLDNDCNAACLMCSGWNSSTWQQYNKKTIKNITSQFESNSTVTERIEAVKKIIDFSKVKQLHLFGGEPLRTNTHLKILKLIDTPELISLVYVTNGSEFPEDSTIELWKKFKHVFINISIDGIDEHFNYLRWPLQWNQVKENLLKYANLDTDNFTINITFTATPFNIHYQDTYINWSLDFFKDTNLNGSNFFTNPSPVGGIINMECVPENLQTIIKKKYSVDSKISKILRPFNPAKYKEFINYVELHDGYRKLSWRETFPEIVQYFEEAI